MPPLRTYAHGTNHRYFAMRIGDFEDRGVSSRCIATTNYRSKHETRLIYEYKMGIPSVRTLQNDRVVLFEPPSISASSGLLSCWTGRCAVQPKYLVTIVHAWFGRQDI